LKDKFGRRLNYIRISVTDRCNYRCVYCMPEEGLEWIPHDRIMTYEEIVFLSSVLHGLGVEKIRFTGGEPLVRKGFFDFLKDLADKVPDIRTVLTTNGSFIGEYIEEIRESGLSGINVSLDSLNPAVFGMITRKGPLECVLKGIRTLSQETDIPIKINTVLMKGVNDEEIPELLDFAMENRATLRLIEFMPLDDSVWREDLFIPASSIFEKLPRPGSWIRIDNSSDHSAGPAVYYKNEATGQKIGIIEAVTQHFCEKCNRLRISATGILRPCLFSEDGIDLRPSLISRDPALVRKNLMQGALDKPECYAASKTGKMHMSRIGG